MRKGGNVINLGENIKSLINKLEPTYPIGVDFDYYYFEPKEVQRSVNDFVNNIIQAVIIVTLVMMISLGLRTGLVVSTLIPMVMLMSIFIMNMFGIVLHMVSLGALIIALGMLVDNAIVLAESISYRMNRGMNQFQAAIEAATELRIPLLIASLTTCAAFLPIYIADSLVAEYCENLFTVTSIALICSWFLSMTMMPLFCAKYLKPGKKISAREDTFDTRFYRFYRKLLHSGLHHPIRTVLIVTVVFILVMSLFPLIPQIFFPPSDQERFYAKLEMPLGTPIETTEQVAKKVDTFIRENVMVNESRKEGVDKWATFIGNGPPRTTFGDPGGGGTPEAIYMMFETTTTENLYRWIKPIETFCLMNFPDLEVLVDRYGSAAGASTPVEIRLSGKEIDKVFEIADVLKAKLHRIPGTKMVKDSWGPRVKKLLVKVDEARARRAGVTNYDIATTLQGALTGLIVTEFREAMLENG